MLDTYFERLEELAELYFVYIDCDADATDAKFVILDNVPDDGDVIEWVVSVGDEDFVGYMEYLFID